MAATKEAVLFCVLCIELSLHLPSFKVRGLQITINFPLRTTSKLNRRLTGDSDRFQPVSIVLNNDNRPEPDGTPGQPAVGF